MWASDDWANIFTMHDNALGIGRMCTSKFWSGLTNEFPLQYAVKNKEYDLVEVYMGVGMRCVGSGNTTIYLRSKEERQNVLSHLVLHSYKCGTIIRINLIIRSSAIRENRPLPRIKQYYFLSSRYLIV